MTVEAFLIIILLILICINKEGLTSDNPIEWSSTFLRVAAIFIAIYFIVVMEKCGVFTVNDKLQI